MQSAAPAVLATPRGLAETYKEGGPNVGESRGTLLIVFDLCYPDAIARVLDAAAKSPEPVQACGEALVRMAEPDPKAAHAALWRLQRDWKTLKRLERGLGGDPTQAALRIGAAIHLARAE